MELPPRKELPMTRISHPSRRRFLALTSTAAAAYATGTAAQEIARPQHLDVGPTYIDARYRDLVEISQDAYIWGFPLVQMGELFKFGRIYDQPMNQMIVARGAALGTYAPNIELLYG